LLSLLTLHSGMAMADIGTDLQLAPVPRSAVMKEKGYLVWDGSMVRDDAGVCHLFYCRWKGTLRDWCKGAEIVRATAKNPLGPYTPQEIALGPRPEGTDAWDGLSVFNQSVVRFGDKYYLYYAGSNGSNFPIPMKDGSFQRSPKGVLITQRIGVAEADHPAGPWRRMEKPLIDISSDGIDSQMCCNPAVTQGGDGTFLMIYKCSNGRPGKGEGGIYLTVATSDSPTGPFKKTQRKILTHPDDRFPAEDPFLWWQDGRYHCIVDDQRGSFSGQQGLVRFESKDGMDWERSTPFVVSRCRITWADGQTEETNHLERPQVWFRDGRPAVLFAAVLQGKESYNVHIPLLGYRAGEVKK
jgi:hypothetical protein